jgi:hypothetical protein
VLKPFNAKSVLSDVSTNFPAFQHSSNCPIPLSSKH